MTTQAWANVAAMTPTPSERRWQSGAALALGWLAYGLFYLVVLALVIGLPALAVFALLGYRG